MFFITSDLLECMLMLSMTEAEELGLRSRALSPRQDTCSGCARRDSDDHDERWADLTIPVRPCEPWCDIPKGDADEHQGQARLQLRRAPTCATYARQRVREFCSDMPADLQATAQLLTSELVTNALRHGEGVIEMCMSIEPKAFRAEISDESPEAPRILHPSPQSTGGRGVLLVEALASSWGTNHHPGDGKGVWFALRTA